MTNEHDFQPELETLALDHHDEDYEEITSEEVDSVLAQLDALSAGTRSENIRAYLEEAADNIYNLIYGDAGELGETAQEAA